MALGHLKSFWRCVYILFLESLLHRTENGEKLGVFSKRTWGSNLMFTGITGSLIAFFWFAQRTYFELDAIATTSEVLEVGRHLTRDRKKVYELTLRWTDQNGQVHETVPRVKASYYNVPVGTELDIKYDPNDPTDVRVETQEGPWYLPRLTLLGSLMTFLMGWVIRGRPQS